MLVSVYSVSLIKQDRQRVQQVRIVVKVNSDHHQCVSGGHHYKLKCLNCACAIPFVRILLVLSSCHC